jgi:hypothetical protein
MKLLPLAHFQFSHHRQSSSFCSNPTQDDVPDQDQKAITTPEHRSQGADLLQLLQESEKYDPKIAFRSRCNLSSIQIDSHPPPPPPPFSTSTVNETLSLDLNKLALYLSMLPLSTVLYTTLIHNDDRDGTRRLAEEFREQLHVEVVEEESRKNNTVDTCIEINSRPVSAAIINEEEEEEEEEEGEDDDELDALLEISDKHQRSSGNGKVGGGYTSSKGDLTDFLDSL